MEVPRPGVQLELLLLGYARAKATPDPSHVCEPHHRSQKHHIPNPLGEVRDQIQNLMVPIWIHLCCTTVGTPHVNFETIVYTELCNVPEIKNK